MTGLKLLGCFTLLVVIVTLNVTHGQLESTVKNQIRFGLKDAQLALDYGKELIKKIKPLSNVLGAFGAFATLIMLFIPSQESAEMTLMKKEFGQINLKLDRLSSQLDNVKALVSYDTQKAAYVKSANKIKFGFKRLDQFQNEITASSNCSTQQSCKRERLLIAERYVDSFNVKQALYEIMIGTSGPGTVFGEPILDLLNNYHQCDIGKVRAFADGVISLAYKGQYIVLAHEKLTGSNQSITTAVRDWSDMAYNIRKKADDIQSKCYSSISQYISKDVKDTKYQTGYDGNKEAAVALNNFLNKKYPWIVWTVLSYGAYGGENHWGFESFINMPKEGRKRVLRVMASDNGTYSSPHGISSKIDSIGKYDIDYDDADDAHDIFSKIKNKVGTSAYNKLLSLVVMTSYTDLEYAETRSLPKFYKAFSRVKNTDNPPVQQQPGRRGTTRHFTIWTMFKSDEQIDGHHCTRSCQNSGTCRNMPFTSKYYCICSKYYYGENCEHYDSVSLGANIESMLTTTVHIPTLVNVYFKIEDLQSYLAVSLNNIQSSIATLNTIIQEKITMGFQWTNLLTQYSGSISDLTYYVKRFRNLNSSDATYIKVSKALANTVLQPINGISRLLDDLNFLIVGRQHFFLSHAPLMFAVMLKNKQQACNTNYKAILDTTWRQIMSLQTDGYIIWAWARSMQNQSSDDIKLVHNKKVSDQTKFMENATCQLQIQNSVNVNCTGGYYMYPGMRIKNQCGENYYLVENATVTCSKPSTCQACNCDSKGSASQECDDQTGKCNCTSNKFYGDKCETDCACYSSGSSTEICNHATGKCDCKRPFYGDKCNDRDCVWSSWINDRCGYPCLYKGTGVKLRRRSKTPRHGNGKECSGYIIARYDPCPLSLCYERRK